MLALIVTFNFRSTHIAASTDYNTTEVEKEDVEVEVIDLVGGEGNTKM